jgi:hypothetical protein
MEGEVSCQEARDTKRVVAPLFFPASRYVPGGGTPRYDRRQPVRGDDALREFRGHGRLVASSLSTTSRRQSPTASNLQHGSQKFTSTRRILCEETEHFLCCFFFSESGNCNGPANESTLKDKIRGSYNSDARRSELLELQSCQKLRTPALPLISWKLGFLGWHREPADPTLSAWKAIPCPS